jgi:tripartite ATP-independent transporter DctM subunit
VLGVILAASTGIIGASVALLGTLALPSMLDDGYQPELAVGTVGDLFLGAVFPGLLLGFLYLAYLAVVCVLRPDLAPAAATTDERAPLSQVLAQLAKGLVPPLALVLAVLGSIFLGVVSPSEAAGVGALGATLLAVLRRRLDLATLREVSRATTRTTAFIFAIFLGATCFAVVLRGLGGDEVIAAAITALPFGATGVVLALMGLVFVLGFFLDWIEITLIVLPLVEPVTASLGIDKLWFTVLVAVCLQTSFLTPPVGFALFYLKGVAPPAIRLGHLYRGVVPFVLLQLLGLAVLFAFPRLVTWLPEVAWR